MIDDKFLKDLILTHTPSGYENLFLQFTENNVLNYISTDFRVDKIKNIMFHKGTNNENSTRIVISAHYDENALQVSAITKNGLIKVMNLGGLDLKTIQGSYVEIITNNFDEAGLPICINGIIGKKPIHKESKEEREKVDEYDKLFVDIGCNSVEEVKELGVNIGNPIVFSKQLNLNFGKDQKHLVGNALDDKIGIYAVSKAFLEIDENILIENNISLYLTWCSQEEVGLRGASIMAKNLNPEISIDVDVCFDNSYYKHKDNENEIKIGNGVVLDYGPHCDLDLVNSIKILASNYALSFQEEVTKPGGNNTDKIQLNSQFCSSIHLGIPCRNMHTQVEMCHADDVESCIDLIKIFVEELKIN